jgi:transposase
VLFKDVISVRATDNKTRENIISAMQHKEKRNTIATWLNVSLSTIDKVWHKIKKTGTYHPIPYTGRKNTLTKKQETEIRTKIQQTPDITLNELIAES